MTTTSSSTAHLHPSSTHHHQGTHHQQQRQQRQPVIAPQPHIPFPALKALVARHQKATQSAPPPVLSVGGRYLPLIYHLVSTLIATPLSSPSPATAVSHCGYTVVIIDAECRFDVTRLVGNGGDSSHTSIPKSTPADADADADDSHIGAADTGAPASNTTAATATAVADDDHHHRHYYPASPADLRHVHVFRPAHSQVRASLAAAGEYMLYGDHGSRDREWWGTVVVGSSGLFSSASLPHPGGGGGTAAATADVLCGYKGWLRVERDEVPGFHMAVSAEEALADRDRRAEAVGRSGWKAVSRWGSYSFGQ